MRFEDRNVYTCTFTNANSTHGKPDTIKVLKLNSFITKEVNGFQLEIY